jgi:beta-glucanase (GH16 family)
MKNYIPLIFVGWLLFGTKASSQIYPPNLMWNGCSHEYDGYRSDDTLSCKKILHKLIFEDTFDSTALNTNKWNTLYPWGRSLHSQFSGTGWERQYYKDENVYVGDGSLHLQTKVDPGERSPEPTTGNIFFNYTSGMVFSKLQYGKGKFEARCKIPKINGLFPAFWLYGFCAQEIDIFEFTNSSKTSDAAIDGGNVIMTYHKAYDCYSDRGQCGFGFTKHIENDLSNDFHLYSVEWDDYKIIWRLDGEISREVYRLWIVSPPAPAGPLYGYAYPIKSCREMNPSTMYSVFPLFPTNDHPMHIILNSAVLMERASEEGALPQEFLIDYVRAYEAVEIPESNSTSGLELYPNPTSGVFYINTLVNGESINKIVILNLVGKEVEFKTSIVNGVYVIDLVGNPKGVYFVQVQTATTSYQKKLVYQ